ncbi:hypothetical protein ACFOY4_34235 [Actinomadura syzygii]|uniref:SH3 domain-containing protein n=1 Tax=Actinomadura syzygii TaxID=1427538 RepID=A0A5D0UMN3_9ACTN|nr:hypothetical protein [Actinomadura syzygii]TYC18875.1 hypothetical protein FXF65_03855 [Actinomadura syzygii]
MIIGPVRFGRFAVKAGTGLMLALALAMGGAAAPASASPGAPAAPAAEPKVHYTNSTLVKRDCKVFFNHPGKHRKDASWPAGPSTSSKEVGVRYTAAGYAMVRDPQRQKAGAAPWWGWINTKCLVDPVARKFPRVRAPRDLTDRPDPNGYAPALPDRHATRGNNSVTVVDITPPARPLHGHVTVTTPGTLRNGANKYAIGGVDRGWTFRITRKHCRRQDGRPYGPKQWVYGYSSNAGRFGWVQANHMPACTH